MNIGKSMNQTTSPINERLKEILDGKSGDSDYERGYQDGAFDMFNELKRRCEEDVKSGISTKD